MSLALAEVCPPPAPEGVGGAAAPAPGSGTRLSDAAQGDEHVEYVAFTAESGSVSKMAIVRRRLARVLGRYLLGEPIAAGGMATVHLGRLLGPAGFSRTVAVKRLHAHLAADPEFVQRFVDEARIASRVRHANVVQTLDVVAIDDELLLVLDYVHGESFARLRRLASAAGSAIPPRVAAGIIIGVLRGLHAAHEAKSAKGTALHLVHRDVSPQNILVGGDGVARVLDFGIAKAAGHITETSATHDLKGKLAYMAPEQVSGEALDRRADLFAVGVVLWEALAGERLFRGEDEASTRDAIYNREPPRLAERNLGVSNDVDEVLARALAKDAADRFDSADAMGRALEAALAPAGDREVAEWVERVAGELLFARAERVATFEGDDTGSSKARLFASSEPSPPPPASTTRATVPEETTSRRNALVPPPLESITNEVATGVGPRGTLPTLEMEAALARASTGSFPGSVEVEGVSELRPVHTPLVMVAPIEQPARESGPTRIDPVERRIRVRTPMPVPMPMPVPLKTRRATSMMQIALLVIVPPLLVVAGLTALRLRQPAPLVSASPVVAPVPAPPAAAPPAGHDVALPGVDLAVGAGLLAADAGVAGVIAPTKSGSRDRKPGRGPVHRSPRTGPRLPVPVTR